MASDKPRALDDLVTAVAQARPHLVDSLEAVAVIESLGYTDARMRREFGFRDTRAFGEYVFERLSEGRTPRANVKAVPTARGALESFRRCLRASLLYAVPWAGTVAIERTAPGALSPPGLGPPLSLALMLSLIVCGGFMQAISRRGHFYVGVGQPGLAAVVCAYFVRIGAMVTIAAAAAGLVLGWFFGLSTWPYLVLWADQFMILCALWLTWAVLTVRDEYWRVPATVAAGVIAFVLTALPGRNAAFGQWIALGAVLAAAVVQVPGVFARAKDAEGPTAVPNPRMTVVLFRELPFVLYGTLFFCFLFADRFVAGVSRARGGGPWLPPEYTLGLDVAVLSMLFASAGVEYASLRFAWHLAAAKDAASAGSMDAFRRAAGQIHLRALAITAFTFVVTVSVVGTAARLLLFDTAPRVWMTLAVADAAYFLLALGLLNALVLFTFHRAWSAINVLIAGLVLSFVVGFVLSRTFTQDFATIGTLTGAALILIASTMTVRRTLRRADHAVATP
jgi:hypothetical protein